jgi:hypothetical protein
LIRIDLLDKVDYLTIYRRFVMNVTGELGTQVSEVIAVDYTQGEQTPEGSDKEKSKSMLVFLNKLGYKLPDDAEPSETMKTLSELMVQEQSPEKLQKQIELNSRNSIFNPNDYD